MGIVARNDKRNPPTTATDPALESLCPDNKNDHGVHSGKDNTDEDHRLSNANAQIDVLSKGQVKQNPDIDGGWGWMVVLGCTLMHLFLGGWSRSYGIVYVKLREKYQGSAAVTAWVGGVGIAVRMGFSPVANGLAKRFTVQSITFIGGILLAVGIMLASFGPSIEYMFFPISFMAGMGGCLVYSPAIVHVGEYFDKKRGIATGISTAGSGIGVFLFPPLFKILFSYYGYFGAMLIFSALMLHCCFSALLYRPLRNQREISVYSMDQKETITDRPTKENSSQSTSVRPLTGLRKYFDYKLMLDGRFLCFAVSMGLVTTAYMSSQILVTDHAIQCGIDETRATLLLSMIGAADIVGRLGSGIVFDVSHIRPIRRHLYQWAIALTSVTIYGWAFSSSFLALLIWSVLHGIFNGCVVSQRAVIVAEIMGIEKLSSSFGLTVFCQGFGALIGPYIAGHLRDSTGDYLASLVFTGTCAIAAFLLLYLGYIYDYTQNKKKKTPI